MEDKEKKYFVSVWLKTVHLRLCVKVTLLDEKSTKVCVEQSSSGGNLEMILTELARIEFLILCASLKVPSHQFRSAWQWYGWIGLDIYMNRGW
jgi:hypothetical protein